MSRDEAASSTGNIKQPDPAVDFVAGVIAGAAGLIVGQPFDVVKVRYQTPEYNGRYGSTLSALRSIVREERVRGLFKGVMSPMAGIAFINGVVFTTYSSLMTLQLSPESSLEPTLGQIALAGSGSGFLSAFITCPTELVKIRQQSAPPHLNPSVLQVLRSIVQVDGVRGMYRGLGATCMRDLAYGPYFCTNVSFLQTLKKPSTISITASTSPRIPNLRAEEELSSLSWPELMVSGGVAGVTAWLVTFPLDVLKTRMQAASWKSSSRYGLVKTAREAMRVEGWRVMFAGLGPTLIRAIPVNMVIFLTFEGCVSGMR